MKHILPFLFMLFYASSVQAQQTDETVYRLELGAGIGTGFHFNDLNASTGLGAALLARFPLNPRMAIKTQLTYSGLKGHTNGIDDYLPSDLEVAGTPPLAYSADGATIDLNALYELHFLPYGYVRDYKGYKRFVPYLQFGLGATYSTPGKAFTLNLPIGIGVKYKVGRRLNLGLDWVVRFSLSDKLDGLDAPLGIKQSGFRAKDHYSVLGLTLTYDLNPRCPTCNKND